MLNILKLHYGLIRFLYATLGKQKTPAKTVRFLLTVFKRYCIVMIQEYKKMFLPLDPEYRKQKKEYEKFNKLKTDLQRARRLLVWIDEDMKKRGDSSQQRAQFWRDFYKDGQIRADVWNRLAKELGE